MHLLLNQVKNIKDMIFYFTYHVTLSKFDNDDVSLSKCNTGVQGGCLTLIPLDGCLSLPELCYICGGCARASNMAILLINANFMRLLSNENEDIKHIYVFLSLYCPCVIKVELIG